MVLCLVRKRKDIKSVERGREGGEREGGENFSFNLEGS